MFNLIGLIKKRLMGTSTLKKTSDQNYSDEFEMEEMSDREKKVYKNVSKKYGLLSNMLHSELNELLDEERRILDQEDWEKEKLSTISQQVCIVDFEDEIIIKKLREKADPKSLKIIETARGIDAINTAIDEGFVPLIQEVVPSNQIYVTDTLIRDTQTGKYTTRQYSYSAIGYGTSENKEIVIMGTRYYPYQFPLPFAAYLLPNDLEKYDRVILNDLIEDIVGEQNSGAVYRQDRAEAIWDGEKFIIDHDSYHARVTIG